MPTCGKCHRDVQEGALFCGFCGAAITPPMPEGVVDPVIGKTLKGMYFVQQRIGGGGMGQVYKAIHVTLDKPVALKILKKALLADPAIEQRFYREARASSMLSHPNVINVTDFGRMDDGMLFMVMEYIAGKSLARIISSEGVLPERRVIHIGAQILSALAEAHDKKILHRDLKPENVMIEARRDEPDSVKVLDFGIAKIQAASGEGQSTLTQAGLVCGTPGYMSPEQWSGQELDARSDLYAMGVILYEMLTGKLPVEALTPMEMVRKHLTEKPQPPSLRCPGCSVSPRLEALVMRALASDRELRPASAEEMRAELLACATGDAFNVTAEPPVTEAQPTVVLPRNTPIPAGQGGGTQVLSGEARPTPGRPTPNRTTPGRPTPTGSGGRSTRPGPRRPPTGDGENDYKVDEFEPEDGARRPVRAKSSGGKVPLIAAFSLAGVLLVALLAVVIWPKNTVDRIEQPQHASVPPPQVGGNPQDPKPQEGLDAGAVIQAHAEPQDAGVIVTAALRPVEPEPVPVKPEPAPPRHRPEPESHAKAKPEKPKLEKPKIAERPHTPSKVGSALNSISTPPEGTGEGVLTVQVEPFGEVFLDGRAYGEAPREFRLPEGAYRVRVTNPALGSRQGSVKVSAGRRTHWSADFMSGK